MAGFAPRGRAELRRLVDAGDLDHAAPSTLWHRRDSGTWRTGIDGDAQPAWQAAAHAAGSVTSWRSFTAEDDDRTVEVQVVPLANAADTAPALDALADPDHRVRRGDRAAGSTRVEAAAGAYVVLVFAGGDWDGSELAAVVAAQVARLG